MPVFKPTAGQGKFDHYAVFLDNGRAGVGFGSEHITIDRKDIPDDLFIRAVQVGAELAEIAGATGRADDNAVELRTDIAKTIGYATLAEREELVKEPVNEQP